MSLAKFRLLWAGGLSLFFFLNLDQFGFSLGVLPAPKYFAICAFVGTVVLFLPKLNLGRIIKNPLFIWMLFYFILSAISATFNYNSGFSEADFFKVISTCLYISAAWLVYSQTDEFNKFWVAILWVALLLSVASICVDYSQAGGSIFSAAGLGIEGRAAGLYLNPTIAAQTVSLILLCIFQRGARKTNFIASAIALIGITLTFSRGGLVAYVLVLVIVMWQRHHSRWLLLFFSVLFIAVVVGSDWLFEAVSSVISPENSNTAQRLSWAFGKASSDYIAEDARGQALSFGWDRFAEAPFIGGGIGFMSSWTTGVGTHNMILRNLVDYGLLGVFVFPLFLYVSMRSMQIKRIGRWLWLSAGLVVVLSMFSHDMLEQACFIFPWLAICQIRPKEKIFNDRR
ncbi:O-antigen ligase family protein [Variovorax guangxiensis]|uniref:O-antigen ligase domain-containing protein n=1 Tax=Variovorax guangxiensis TaxID=1775474 RepID=A0A502DLZ1_9BURK|nr:O-antigen ligase family protein [Variovorax guangxiensis]TPG20631.1 O-antigen ligase domain-containing protein [Variovorax ginsengisoli]TPG25782.1 O-antigen ligase domain-containing protein [Variovorax guangxiensis]